MPKLTLRPGSAIACLAVFSALLCLAGSAQAQWAWRDAAGNITYSDSPPPADIQPRNILQQPAPISAADLRRATSGSEGVDSAQSPGAPGGTPPAAPPPATRSLAEQEADFRKRAAEREKAAQKAEQEEAQASSRAAACSQARGYLQLIESGTRLMRPDAEGNRNYMDEDQRAAEVQKAQDGISKNCT